MITKIKDASMKTIFTIFLLFLSVLAFGQQVWTLEQCMAHAKKENLTLKQKVIETQNAEIQLRQSKQNLLPDLNMFVGQSFSFGRSIDETNTYQNNNVQSTNLSVSSSINVYDGGRMFYAIQKSKLDFEAMLLDVEQQTNTIELQVLSSFFQVLYAKKQHELAQNQYQLTLSQLERTEALVNAGRLPNGELYQVKAQLSQDNLSVLQAHHEVKNTLMQLAQLLLIEDVESFDIDDMTVVAGPNQLLPPFEEIYLQTIENLASVKANQIRVESANTQVKIEKSGFYPRLSVGASYGNGYYYAENRLNLPFSEQWQQNQNMAVSLNLQIPIFNKMSVVNRVKQSELAVKSQELNAQSTKIQLRQELQQAYLLTIAAREKIIASESNVRALKMAFDYQKEKFDNGVSTIFEYNEAKNALTRALSIQSQSMFEFLFRSKAIELYMGK